ncbi:MAG: helix-turn-helix domain-containing protein [Clostridiales bacterium]|nr:helix-turn-helix domain-containing protein [Clostridiales bacterium]
MKNFEYTIKTLRPQAVEHRPFHLIRDFGTNDYLFLLFKSYGEITIDGVKKYYNPYDGILLTPFTPHEIRTIDALLVHDWIHFYVNDEKSFNSIPFCFNTLFHCHKANLLSQLVSMIYNEHNEYHDDKNQIINSLMNILIRQLIHQSTLTTFLNNQELRLKAKFDTVRNDIYTNHKYPNSIDELANSLFLSNSRFSHLYKKFYNVSPLHDLNTAKIQHAQQLLQTSDLSIAEISEQCMFNNVYHFIRYFKSRTGIPPGKWAKANFSENKKTE